MKKESQTLNLDTRYFVPGMSIEVCRPVSRWGRIKHWFLMKMGRRPDFVIVDIDRGVSTVTVREKRK